MEEVQAKALMNPSPVRTWSTRMETTVNSKHMAILNILVNRHSYRQHATSVHILCITKSVQTTAVEYQENMQKPLMCLNELQYFLLQW